MIAVLGVAGQVGSMLATELLKRGKRVKAVLRNPQKAQALKEAGAEVSIADYTDAPALKAALEGCKSAFLITPENPFSKDLLAEARLILSNYREVVLAAEIKEIIGLSSGGAQHKSGTGNLTASYELEHLFSNAEIKQIFIRPGYYFSNLTGYFDTAKEHGILPSFFPVDLKVAMIAPLDVALFAADVITHSIEWKPLYEIYNEYYSVQDIAKIIGATLKREVTAQTIPQSEWFNTMNKIGFSDSGANNFALMTQAVIEGKTSPETKMIKLPINFQSYLKENI